MVFRSRMKVVGGKKEANELVYDFLPGRSPKKDGNSVTGIANPGEYLSEVV